MTRHEEYIKQVARVYCENTSCNSCFDLPEWCWVMLEDAELHVCPRCESGNLIRYGKLPQDMEREGIEKTWAMNSAASYLKRAKRDI